jgi:hypothetical protein
MILGPRPRSRLARRREALGIIARSGVPFLVGGAYALRRYTGTVRGTRDLDLFVRRRDAATVLGAFAAAGLDTDVPFPHWLGKARIGGECVDVIYSSGNGVAEVDDDWFHHATPGLVLGIPARLCPPEEMIWSKAFVMERERYDGADICHLIRARGKWLDWRRLLVRFGGHWRVLLSHLTLFGFVYPGERDAVPAWVTRALCHRLAREADAPPMDGRVCQGTLLSRQQYLVDVACWGYTDGRLAPHGSMTPSEIEQWTAAIEPEKTHADADRGGR